MHHLILRLGRRERPVPDRQRGLPDGDPGDGHSTLLCYRYRLGGITGPVFFGQLIGTGERSSLLIGYLIAAGLMVIAALVELALGVRAERRSLESLAAPLTAIER